jgi:O-antigen/teichoic acid export membrane protein
MPDLRSSRQLRSRQIVALKNCLNVRSLGTFFSKANADRGKERYRRASLTASASIFSQALGVLISIVSVPLTVRYLGQERYGVWLTISSLMTWMTMTDFGLTGNALINLMSEAHGTDNRVLARQYASSTFWTLIAIMLSLGTLFTVTFAWIPWRTVFRVSAATSTEELRVACALAIGIFLLTFPLNMLNSLYNAYQDGFVSNIWTIGGNLLALVSLIAVTQFKGGLPHLVFALSGTRVLVGLANGYYVFFRRYRWLAPRLSAVSWAHIKRLLKLSSKYMVAQVSALGMSQSQPMIITQFLGPAYVPIFVVAYRLITIPQSLVFIATAPLLSAYGEARARGDWKWIKGALRNSTLISAVGGAVLVIALAVAAKPIIRIWAGPATVPDTALVVWLSIFTVIGVALNPAAQMLWGLERVGVPALGLAVCAIATIKLSMVLAKSLGLTGIALAMTVSFFLCFLIQAYEVWRALREVSSASREAEACAAETLSV